MLLVAWHSIIRRALAFHTSQLRPFDNPSVYSLTALMVQTRRSAQLAVKDTSKPKPVDVKPLTKGERTNRPLKRAKKEHQPDERRSSVATTEKHKEFERES